MKILYSKIEEGELRYLENQEYKDFVEENKNYKGLIRSDVRKTTKERTDDQNRALHLWYTQVANLLNDAGYNVQIILAQKMDIDWTPTLVKEILWRTAQQAILQKYSTTKLEKVGEIERVEQHLVRHLGEKFGIELPQFPHDPNKIR